MRKAVTLALLMFGGAFVPAASGYHMSIGGWDAFGVSSEESTENPTVSAEALQRGTTPPEQCEFGPDDTINDSESLQEGLASDAFCSHLYYNADTDFVREAPEDQQILADSEVGSFDVVYTSYVGNYQISTCIPWCYPPGTLPVYKQLHDVGAMAGVTEDGDTVQQKERTGWQTYAINVNYPAASQVAQRQTGAWEMNGPAIPQPDHNFVGMLTDPSGETIDDTELQAIFERVDTDNDAVPFVCGFTPDAEITINAPQASFCEVVFKWFDEDSPTGDGDLQQEDYNDPCGSPAYVCGANNPSWYAQMVCSGALSSSVNDPCGTPNAYEAWHWVVGPAPSECSGDVEPGFQLSSDGSGLPYLAHDLDVYTPIATAAGNSGTADVDDGLNNGIDQVEENVSRDLEEATSPVPGVPTLTVGIPRDVSKVDRMEPNAQGDTSQELEFPRSLEKNTCSQVRPGTEDVNDPWRNMIDTELHSDAVALINVMPYDLYQNSDPDQDDDNRPGTTYQFFYADGNVGVFADKNDDGAYSTVGSNDKVRSINDAGAYPMVWDVVLNDDKLDQGSSLLEAMEGGCNVGFSDVRWTDSAKTAGYGPRTGLIQVLYLQEPTVLYNYNTGEPYQQTQGDTAYVFLSDNYQDMIQFGVEDDFVKNRVQNIVDNKIPGEVGNVLYAHELTPENTRDFSAQCAEDTGGYTNSWSFIHTCGGTADGSMCADDTIVTQYVLDTSRTDDGVLGGGGSALPTLTTNAAPDGIQFPTPTDTWTDVDPLDGDPERNTDTCMRPAHHEDPSEDPRGETSDDTRYPCGHSH